MRHAILGYGGVGGFVAAVLAQAGHEVTAVVRRPSLMEQRARLDLDSPLGTVTTAVSLATRVAEPFDLLWICVKAPQLAAALAAIDEPERLGGIVPLLNGVDHIALLRTHYGHQRVLPATILGECERLAPGQIVHRSPRLQLRFAAAAEAQLGRAFADLRQFGADCQLVADEPTLMWSKLVVLAPMALATSAAAQPMGAVLASAEWRPLLEAAHAEACAVAASAGAHIDVAATRATLLGMPAGLRTSMQKDVEAGREPELDAIAGPILRGGSPARPTPATAELAAQVRARSPLAASTSTPT